jgi:hypothetical protein
LVADAWSMKSFAVGEQESFGLAKGAPALGVPNIIKFATSLILLLFKNTLLSNPPLDRFVQIS